MNRLIDMVGLSREAILFDSKLYIIKAILAIATGYLLGKAMPIARVDMISVLLGVMYNLEPLNMSGLKGGIDQLVASTIGAVCTGVLIALFGINVFTIAISMALTLYVSLKINWRMVSPVAIFTCIYMTQYVQLDAAGDPSIWLTFRLRIVALGLGILIAVVYNYISSFFYYRKIAYKRLQFAKLELLRGLEYTESQLKGENEGGRDYITLFPSIFNNMDLVYSNVDIMIKESKYFINFLKPEKLRSAQIILQYFRDINHLAYDINFEIWREPDSKGNNAVSINKIKGIVDIFNRIDFTFTKINRVDIKVETVSRPLGGRIDANLEMIEHYLKLVLEESVRLNAIK